jgi:hypothetical protein
MTYVTGNLKSLGAAVQNSSVIDVANYARQGRHTVCWFGVTSGRPLEETYSLLVWRHIWPTARGDIQFVGLSSHLVDR